MNRYIEFVEKEIEFCQLKINKAKEEKIYRETIALIVPENKNINLVTVNEIEISLNEYKIKCLHQIKCVLEAWEVVKRYTSTPEDVVEGGYYFIKGLDDEFETIKKALELEDDKEC